MISTPIASAPLALPKMIFTVATTSVTFTTENPHGLAAPTRLSISTASYSPVAGILTVTTTANHGLTSGDFIGIDDDSLTFRCTMDGTWSDHTYPRGADNVRDNDADPVSGKWLSITNVNTANNTFEVNVGKSPLRYFTPTAATYDIWQISGDENPVLESVDFGS